MVSSLLSDHRIEVAEADGTLARIPVPSFDGDGYSRQLSCQIWSLDGRLVGRSFGAPEARLAEPAAEGYSISIVDGEPWQVFSVVNPDLGLRVMVGDSVAVRDRLVRGVIEGFLLPTAIVLPLLGLLIWISVSRGLAPLDRLAENLRSRTPSDLSPLPQGALPREIRPVRRALDTLFARVAAARDLERDFTTFAAHELKTPLAGLRVHAQVMRMASDKATRDAALHSIETSVDRTDRMVRQLLELAEVDRTEISTEPCDLPVLACETQRGLATLAQSRGVSVHVDAGAGCTGVPTNPFLLGAALRNVMENAILASPEGGRVSVAVHSTGGGFALDVSDEGPGIPPDIRDRLTKPFTRGPAAHGQGSGLGLAIVAKAMDRLNGRLEFLDGAGNGLTVRLWIEAL